MNLSSAIGDAIAANMVASFDPMQQGVRTLMQQQIQAQQKQFDMEVITFVEDLKAKIAKAIEEKADEDIVNAYRRLVAKYTTQ